MANFHFRLFVRPTVIGKAIIARLTAEGTDRQADARRWLELGYALEQAGFRLDGTTVFHGGRMVTAEQASVVEIPVQVAPSVPELPQAVPQTPSAYQPPVAPAVAVGPARDHSLPQNHASVAASVPSPAAGAGAATPAAAPAEQPNHAPLPVAAPLTGAQLEDDMAANLLRLSA